MFPSSFTAFRALEDHSSFLWEGSSFRAAYPHPRRTSLKTPARPLGGQDGPTTLQPSQQPPVCSLSVLFLRPSPLSLELSCALTRMFNFYIQLFYVSRRTGYVSPPVAARGSPTIALRPITGHAAPNRQSITAPQDGAGESPLAWKKAKGTCEEGRGLDGRSPPEQSSWPGDTRLLGTYSVPGLPPGAVDTRRGK